MLDVINTAKIPNRGDIGGASFTVPKGKYHAFILFFIFHYEYPHDLNQATGPQIFIRYLNT
jgi:hypothetical protein